MGQGLRRENTCLCTLQETHTGKQQQLLILQEFLSTRLTMPATLVSFSTNNSASRKTSNMSPKRAPNSPTQLQESRIVYREQHISKPACFSPLLSPQEWTMQL